MSPSTNNGAVASRSAGATTITVLNWNLYVGADLDAVIGALVSPDPADDLPALLAALATFQETDYPARAETTLLRDDAG